MKFKYFIFFFLFAYLLTGLALTFAFAVPNAKRLHNKALDKKCAEERAKQPPCGFPAICIGPGGCFGPDFSIVEYFKTPKPYIETITWPSWFYKNTN